MLFTYIIEDKKTTYFHWCYHVLNLINAEISNLILKRQRKK